MASRRRTAEKYSSRQAASRMTADEDSRAARSPARKARARRRRRPRRQRVARHRARPRRSADQCARAGERRARRGRRPARARARHAPTICAACPASAARAPRSWSPRSRSAGARSSARAASASQILAARDAAQLLVPQFGSLPVEHFGVLLLDTKHRVLRTTLALGRHARRQRRPSARSVPRGDQRRRRGHRPLSQSSVRRSDAERATMSR